MIAFVLAAIAVQPKPIQLKQHLWINGHTYRVTILNPEPDSPCFGESIGQKGAFVVSCRPHAWLLSGGHLSQIRLPGLEGHYNIFAQHGESPLYVDVQDAAGNDLIEQYRDGSWRLKLVAKPGQRVISSVAGGLIAGAEVTPIRLSAAIYRDGMVWRRATGSGSTSAVGIRLGTAYGYSTQGGRLIPAKWSLVSNMLPQLLPVPKGIRFGQAVDGDGRITVGFGSSKENLPDRGARDDIGLIWDRDHLMTWQYVDGGLKPALVPRTVVGNTVIGYSHAKTIEGQLAFVACKNRVSFLPDLKIRNSRLHFIDVKDVDRAQDLLCDVLLTQPGKSSHMIVAILKPRD